MSHGKPLDITFDFDGAGGGCDIIASDEEGESRSPNLRMNAYTGGKLALRNFRHPVVIDTDGVKAMDAEQLPVLRDHKPDKVVGHGKPIIESDGLSVQGSLSVPGKDRDDIVQASTDGFRWQSSVGGRIPNRRRDVKLLPRGRSQVVNGQPVEGPAFIVKAFLWKETSVTALGADEGYASARIAASDSSVHRDNQMNEFNEWLEASGFPDESDLTDAALKTLRRQFDSEVKASESNTDGVEIDVDQITASVADQLRRELRTGRNLDRQMDRIFAQYADVELPGEQTIDDLRASVEDGEVSIDKAHLTLLQASRGTETSTVNKGLKGGDLKPLTLEAAVMRKSGISDDDILASMKENGATDQEADIALTEATGKRYRNAGLKSIIAAACNEAGHSLFNGEVGDDEIRCALGHNNDIEATSGFSTVSLVGILSRLANKAMLAAYAEADNGGAMTRIASQTSTNDFKKFNRYRMTESGTMKLVPASGEIPHGTLLEEEYENQVQTYGKIIALTRQMQRNDDLNAFLQVPRLIGRMGRHSLEQIGIGILVDAPTNAAAGTTEFFHGAARGNQEPNYYEGADSALSIDSLDIAYTLFLNQVDADGKPIMIDPSILLTTNHDHVTARKLYNDIEYRFTASDTKETVDNQWKGMFRPEKSSYLHRLGAAPSTVHWFLLSDPTTDVSGIQIAYLDNQRTPVVQQGEVSFNVLGAQWRGVFDFGIALQDPRAIVKMKGEA